MVLTALNTEELKEIFDEKAMKVMRFSLAKSMLGQPEPILGQQALPYQIAKEHIEQWMVQALGVESVGSGSYPIDIYNKEEKWGADVKMLSCKIDYNGALLSADSGETSLAQNFKGSGNNLDQQFKEKKYLEAVKKWLEIVEVKLKSVEKDYPINDIYYFFFLRAGMTFYLAGLKVNPEELKNVIIDEQRISGTSIYTKNYIDSTIGNVKLYKSKKRLELRLRPDALLKNNMLLEVMHLDSLENINLRELVDDEEKAKKYLINISENYVINNLFKA
ncbi:hypothetical protein [Xanthomarina sp. F2636L]|uniref:hypothetical protein n=1 Tax=Xanthomarina sp. F2636L TaxID=2996018 RepID=UPI00225DFFAC|nr:hypothetical protein [Xanthomarina sp. F2636L]MCX7550883.1 hypothetical protein [Xanthomarina sp. F2636L]